MIAMIHKTEKSWEMSYDQMPKKAWRNPLFLAIFEIF